MNIKIDLNKIIKPWLLAWGFFGLSIITTVLCILLYTDGNERVQNAIDRYTYIKERQTVDKIMTEADRYIKVTTMNSRIIATYGKKWGRKKDSKVNGLSAKEEADVIREMYVGEKLLNLPHFSIIPFAKRESGFIPASRTYWKDGTINEAGLYNQRQIAVDEARGYLERLPKNLKNRFSFYYTKQEDLYDPVNATKIQLLLLWGGLQDYNGNMCWAVLNSHWGKTRIYPLYKSGILPPKRFTFNKKTLREDSRNPFTYYFIWNANFSQFSKFTTKVYVDPGWLSQYKKRANKYEWEYITVQKLVIEINEEFEDLKEERIEFQEERIKGLNKIGKKIIKLKDKYKEWNRKIKKGEFTDIKDIYFLAKQHVSIALKEIVDEKTKKSKKRTILLVMFSVSILIIFSIIGFIFIFIKILLILKLRFKKWLKNKKK